MSHTYKYTKEVIADVLHEMISFNSTLRPKFEGLMVKVNGDGTVPDDNVEVVMTEVLLSAEEDELTAIVNSYGPANQFVVRYGIEQNVMTPAVKFGNDFLMKFASNNIYLGKTPVQIGTLLNTYPDLIHASITGSLTALYATISSMVADENISQEEIDEFKLRLEIYLGIV